MRQEWRPDAEPNLWDYDADDGSAAWLLENAQPDYNDKKKLFKNQVRPPVRRHSVEAFHAEHASRTPNPAAEAYVCP